MNPIITLADKVVERVEQAMPFGKFERLTAGVCMASPFFLIVADLPPEEVTFWMVAAAALVTFLPFLIVLLDKFKGPKTSENFGMIITIAGGIILFSLYWFFTHVFQLESRESISAYVLMDQAYYFGMLLTIAAMLFIANGVVFWGKKIRFKEGAWRSLVNVFLGVLLLGVIIVPFNTYPTLHFTIAMLFFVGCGVSTGARKTKKEKAVQHRLVDFGAVAVMLGAMAVHFGQEFGWISGWPFTLVNLFGAESIALWVTGLDFILVSLKRELAAVTEEEGVAEQIINY